MPLHLTHEKRVLAEFLLFRLVRRREDQQSVLNEGVRVRGDRAVREGQWIVSRQPLTVVSAEVAPRRRHGERVAVVTSQRTINGVWLLRTVRLSVNRIDWQMARVLLNSDRYRAGAVVARFVESGVDDLSVAEWKRARVVRARHRQLLARVVAEDRFVPRDVRVAVVEEKDGRRFALVDRGWLVVQNSHLKAALGLIASSVLRSVGDRRYSDAKSHGLFGDGRHAGHVRSASRVVGSHGHLPGEAGKVLAFFCVKDSVGGTYDFWGRDVDASSLYISKTWNIFLLKQGLSYYFDVFISPSTLIRAPTNSRAA